MVVSPLFHGHLLFASLDVNFYVVAYDYVLFQPLEKWLLLILRP